jgi:hypothetical protein
MFVHIAYLDRGGRLGCRIGSHPRHSRACTRSPVTTLQKLYKEENKASNDYTVYDLKKISNRFFIYKFRQILLTWLILPGHVRTLHGLIVTKLLRYAYEKYNLFNVPRQNTKSSSSSEILHFGQVMQKLSIPQLLGKNLCYCSCFLAKRRIVV